MKFQPKLLKTAFVLAAAASLSACTTTSPMVGTKYYSVRGETARELDNSIRKSGPMKGHAIAVAAISFVPVKVEYKTEGGYCSFKQAKFRVVAEVTLPKWESRNRSKDRELKRSWDALSRYAKKHEDVHVQIADKFAEQLGRGFMRIPPQKSCDALDVKAKNLLAAMKKAHNKIQLDFDAAEEKRIKRLMAEAEKK